MNSKKIDILIELYKEHTKWCQHHEQQRTNVSNMILFMCSILLGLISFDKIIEIHDLPISIFIIILGVFGLIFNYKFYERFDFHNLRINNYLKEISLEIENLDIKDINRKAWNKSSFKNTSIQNTSLYKFWIYLHLLVVIIGIFTTIMAMIGISYE